MSERELLIRIDEKVRNLEREFREFKDNMAKKFVEHEEFATCVADVKWLKKFFWVVAGAAITGLVAGLIALLF